MRRAVGSLPEALRLAGLYGLLALFSFPTLETLLFRQRGLGYELDVFDPAGGVARIGATVEQWSRYGLTWWDPYFGTGNDILAQHSIAPFAPDVALGFAFGSFAAYAFTAWLMAATAGLGMHLFLRDNLRLPFGPCLIGSIVYLFGFWHYIYGFSALGLPIALWLADRAVRPSRVRWRAVVGLVLLDAFLMYAGQSQVALIMGALQLAWLLVAGPEGTRVRDRVGIWLGAWVLSLALTGPVLLAQLTWLPGSERAAWNLADLYDSRVLSVITDTLTFYSSLLFGVPVGANVGLSPGRYGTFFSGAAGLALIAIAISVVRRRPRVRGELFIVGLLVAIPLLDAAAVLFTPIQENLGFLRSFQLVRIRHAMPFAVAALCAIGAARVLRWWPTDPATADLRRRLPSGRLAWLVVIGLALGLLVAWQIAAAGGPLLAAIRHGGPLGTANLGRLLIVGSLVIGVAAIALGAAVWMRGRPVGRVVVLLVVGLLILDRAAYAHGERLLNGSLGTYAEDIARTPAQAFVQAQGPPEQNRVLSLGLFGDRMGGVGIFQADGYQAIYPLGVHDLFGVLTDPTLRDDPTLYTYFHSWGVRAYAFGPEIDPEVAQLMGIRWFVVRGDYAVDPRFEERYRDGTDVVYEIPDVIPRAFVAAAVAPAATRDEILANLGTATRDQLAGTVFVLPEDRGRISSSIPTATDGVSRPVQITRYTPDRQELAVRDGPAGIVVLTDATGPGWVASVDGVPAPVVPVDLAFRGVEVGPGPHQVTFAYEPVATRLGFVVLLVALGGLAGWASVIRRADRRSVPGPG